jgi:hypothetical protein
MINILKAKIVEMRPEKMEQSTFKNVNCLNTNIYSYLVTSGGKSSNIYLNAVHFLQQC